MVIVEVLDFVCRYSMRGEQKVDYYYEQILCVYSLVSLGFFLLSQFLAPFAFFTTGRSDGWART